MNASIRMQRIGRLDTANVNNLRQLRSISMQLAKEYSKPVLERDSNIIVRLEVKTNKLEKDLARSIAEYNPSIKQVSWKEIEKKLKHEEAAIEFVRFRSFIGNQIDSIYYAAMIIRKGSLNPIFVPLCEEKQMAMLFQKTLVRMWATIQKRFTPAEGQAPLIRTFLTIFTICCGVQWKSISSTLEKYIMPPPVYFTVSIWMQ